MSRAIMACLPLILSGGLPGCSTRHVPSAPSAEQVRAWAGFPEDFRLQAKVEFPANTSDEKLGKPIWGATYENSERSLVSLGIAIYQRGTLWGTNHTQFPTIIEKQIEKMRTLKHLDEFSKKADQIVALPNGRKAYFTVLGFGPGGEGLAGFCYERDYDLIVTEDFSTEHGVPAKEQIKNPASPTNDLTIIFGKVEKFLQAQ
jgi:hypothetical protein